MSDGSSIQTHDSVLHKEEVTDERTATEKLEGCIFPSVCYARRWEAPIIVDWLISLGVQAEYRKHPDANKSDSVIVVPGYILELHGTIVVKGPNDVIVFN